MHENFLKIATIILALLVFLAVIPWIADSLKGKGSETTFDDKVSVNLSLFAKNSVDRISIRRKDADEIILESAGEAWTVGSEPADPDKITALFQAFARLNIREMTSKSEKNFAKLGVTEETGIRLALREKNGKEQVFFVGNPGVIPQEFSLRKDGIKNTYSVQGTLRELLVGDADSWKKKADEKADESTTPSEMPVK